VQALPAQVGHSAKANRPLRALGLVELAPNGQAHLVPIAILVDGQYFDAGAYKAAPVPMALWSDTVYEAVRTGVRQGLFTVTGALQQKDTKAWMAEGIWRPGDLAEAKTTKKPEPKEPRGLHEDDPPPVLRRGAPEKPKPSETPAAPAEPAAKVSSPSAGPSSATPAVVAEKTETPAVPDPDRPILKRGKQEPKPAAAKEPEPHVDAPVAKPVKAAAADAVQLIPAISDAGGPDARPYGFIMKPEEEQQFRKKLLAMASDAVRDRARQLDATDSIAGATAGAAKRSQAKTSKALQPSFEDVQLRVFDLSNSNEPELVLSAKAHMPPGKGSTASDVEYMVTLVAREDVNAEFHLATANVADSMHLDVLPRLELIDAVDVDGDGRGELLFRRVSDAGTAFVVYRVIGDRLYPLFEGTPGS
jgi:hypothetical protein